MRQEDIEDIANAMELLMDTLAPEKVLVFLATLRLFTECCKKDSEVGVVLIVRRPTSVDDWTLNVTSLNATRDDAYEMLDVAYSRLAEDISAEAPSRERFN
jgi:hypothetical protein